MTSVRRCGLYWLTALALLMTSVAAAAPQGADAKIDPGLMRALLDSQDGTAAFFVVFGERTPLAAAYGIRDWAARGRFVVQSLQATANRSQNGVRGYLQGRGIDFSPFWVVNAVYIPDGTLDLAHALAQRPEVAAIMPNVIFTIPDPQATQNAVQSVGWNISLIRADGVWSAFSDTGAGIVVANIDTGVQYNHPALVSQYRGTLVGGGFSHAGNWYDPANKCGGAPCDNVGHGTHTMGTMVGTGGIGVAPGAKWIACKGCESGSCSSSSLISCAQWVMAPGGSAANRPNIVNNSWGGGSGSTWYQSYVRNWVAAGIFPAFSNGNSGPNCGTANSPGDYPESFASGATDSVDAIASFSSRGPSAFGGIKPNVSAPGVSIYSSVPTDSYAYYNGTSMASPHTAGVVALLWAIRPGYKGNISATESLIAGNAVGLGTTQTCGGISAGLSPNNTYGYGRIDALQTVNAGGSAPNQPPTVTITAPSTDGQQFNCQTAVSFAATASDPQDGTLTSTIQWSGAGTSSGTGGNITRTFSCTELGNRTVTATATDSVGLSASDSVIVNIVNPNGPPAAPSSLTARVSSRIVNLSWVDNSNNETGFNVYRRSQTGKKWGNWVKIASANATSYGDSTAPVGNNQYYVTAYNGSGESAPSNTASAKVK